MTSPQDTFWDELGASWTAIEPEIDEVMPRVKQQLRRQSLLITAGMIFGFPLTVAGLALGTYTLWIGTTTGAWNFVIRGIAVLLIALMAGRAVLALLSVRASDDTQSLSAMLELAIARAQRTLLLIKLGLYASLIAGVFGIAGTVIRTYQSAPPQQSPVIDLLLLALFALALALSSGHVKASLTRMTVLRNLLTIGGSN